MSTAPVDPPKAEAKKHEDPKEVFEGTTAEPEWEKKYPEEIPRHIDGREEFWMITIRPPRKILEKTPGSTNIASWGLNTEYFYRAMWPVGHSEEG